MDPLKSCMICHQPLAQRSLWNHREAIREHFAAIHSDLFEALTKYEDETEKRVKRVIVLPLLLWLLVLAVAVFSTEGRVGFLFVVIWFDVFTLIGLGGAASLIPRWRAFLRLMKSTPALCRVCDVETTVEGEYEHVRVVHPETYWRMRTVRAIVYLTLGGPVVVMIAAFHLFMLEVWSDAQFEAVVLWTVLGFLVAVVIIGLWAWTLGPKAARRIRENWREGRPPYR